MRLSAFPRSLARWLVASSFEESSHIDRSTFCGRGRNEISEREGSASCVRQSVRARAGPGARHRGPQTASSAGSCGRRTGVREARTGAPRPQPAPPPTRTHSVPQASAGGAQTPNLPFWPLLCCCPQTRRIPKLIHQTWSSASVPAKFQAWAKSWCDQPDSSPLDTPPAPRPFSRASRHTGRDTLSP